MKSFTLDTNCIIDMDEDRPAKAHIQILLHSMDAGQADLALVASSASERQTSGEYLQSLEFFENRRKNLGLAELQLLPSIGRFNISFFGNSLYSFDAGNIREESIYSAMFPSSPFAWKDFAQKHDIDPNDTHNKEYRKWRNQLLDAQAYWAHDHAKRDVFVTSDRRFKVLQGHPDFPAAIICNPEEALGQLGA